MLSIIRYFNFFKSLFGNYKTKFILQKNDINKTILFYDSRNIYILLCITPTKLKNLILNYI